MVRLIINTTEDGNSVCFKPENFRESRDLGVVRERLYMSNIPYDVFDDTLVLAKENLVTALKMIRR